MLFGPNWLSAGNLYRDVSIAIYPDINISIHRYIDILRYRDIDIYNLMSKCLRAGRLRDLF